MSKNLLFISMFGELEHYNPKEFSNICSTGLEKDWILAWHGPAAREMDFEMMSVDICRGDELPNHEIVDSVILGGTLHVIDEDRTWLVCLRNWLTAYRSTSRPLFAICGGHQLLATQFGEGQLVPRPAGTLAGTHEVQLTEQGRAHPLFSGLGATPKFHFANYLHIEPSAAQRDGVLAVQSDSSALVIDHGDNWFSSQFHPESRMETWTCTYARTHPDYLASYAAEHDGAQLIANFIALSARELS